MADEALISFATDINSVVAEIRNGFNQVEALQQRFGSRLGNVSTDQFSRALSEMDTAINRTDSEFRKLITQLNSGKISGANFTAAANTIIKKADEAVGLAAGRHGISLDVALELRKDIFSTLNSQINAGLKTVRERAQAQLGDLTLDVKVREAAQQTLNLLGNPNARVESSRRAFDQGRLRGQASPAPATSPTPSAQQVDTGDAQREAKRLAEALKDAADNAEGTADGFAVVKQATASAATSAGRFAAALEQAARNAEDAANQGIPLPQPNTTPTPQPTPTPTPTPSGPQPKPLNQNNPPLPNGGGGGGGGGGDGEGPSPEEVYQEALRTATSKINYGLDKDGQLAKQKAEEVKRVAEVIRASYERMGIEISNIDPKAIQAAFLRGTTKNPLTGADEIRGGGYAEGVYEFDKNRIVDTRFSDKQGGYRPEYYAKTELGDERYIPDEEAFRRAQEAMGEVLTREQNLLELQKARGTDRVTDLGGGRAVLRDDNLDPRFINSRTGATLEGADASKALLDFAEKLKVADDQLTNLRLLTSGDTERGQRFNTNTTDLGARVLHEDDQGVKRGFKFDKNKLPVEVFGEELRQLELAAQTKIEEDVLKFSEERRRVQNLQYLRVGRDFGEEFGAHVTKTGTNEAVATDLQGNNRAFNTRTGEELVGDDYLEAINRFVKVMRDKTDQIEALDILTRGKRADQEYNDQSTPLSRGRVVTNDNGVERAFKVNSKGAVDYELRGRELEVALIEYRKVLDKRAQTETSIEATERLTNNRRAGQRFNDNVVEISPGLIAEYDEQLQQAIAYYKVNNKGIATQITTQDELIRAEQSLGKSLAAEAERAYKEGQERNKRANLANLTKGADPTQNRGFVQGVVPLTDGYVADLRGDVAEFYKRQGDGFVKLGDESYERQVAIGKLQERLDSETEKQLRADNAKRLYDANTKSGLSEGAQRYSGGVTILEDGVRNFYKSVADGLRKVEGETAEYQKELVKFNQGGGTGRTIGGAFLHGLGSSFGGNNDGLAGLATAAGSTLKYTALYSAINLVTGALAQAGAEAVNFEDSQTNLAIAMENATEATSENDKINQQWLGSLESISIDAGSNVGDVMDVVASGIRTIGTNAEYSKQEIQTLGTEFGRQAQIMSVLAKTDVTDAAGNLRAIGSSFNIPLESSSRINDAFVVGKNIGGGDETETSQAVASAGESLKAAGFTLEQSFALASRIQAATDQTGAAVGNKLSRITSIVSGTAGQAAILKANSNLPTADQVDISASPEEQLRTLSKAYNAGELSTGSIKALTNSLGGTSSAKEFITILEQYSDIADEVAKKTDIAGKADDEYQKRLKDLSEQVRQFKGALSAIAVNLVQSGALDPLLAGFKLLVEFLKFLAGATNVINQVRQSLGAFGTVLPTIVFLTTAVLALGQALKGLRNLGEGSLATGINRAAIKAEETLRPTAALNRRILKQTSGTDLAHVAEEELTTAPVVVAPKPKTPQELYPNNPQFKQYKPETRYITDAQGNPTASVPYSVDEQKADDKARAHTEAIAENEAFHRNQEQQKRRASGGTAEQYQINDSFDQAKIEYDKRAAEKRAEQGKLYADTSPQFKTYETYTKPAYTDENGKTQPTKTYTAEQQARDDYRKAEAAAFAEQQVRLNKERAQAAEQFYRQAPVVDSTGKVLGAEKYALDAEEAAYAEKSQRETPRTPKVSGKIVGEAEEVAGAAKNVLPEVGAVAKASGGLKAAGAIGLELAGGPFGLAVAGATVGLTALAGIKSRSDDLSKAMKDADTALSSVQDLGLTSESTNADIVDAYKNQASAIKAQSDNIKEASSGFLAGLANIFTGKKDDAKTKIAALDKQVDFAQAQADKFSKFTDDLSGGVSALAVFGDKSDISVDSLNQGLQTLEDQAYSSQDRIRLLATYLGLLGDAAGNATGDNPFTTVSDQDRQKQSVLAAQGVAAGAPATTPGSLPGYTTVKPGVGIINVPATTSIDNSGVQKFLKGDQQNLSTDLFNASPTVAKGSNGAYSDEQIDDIANTVADQAADDWMAYYKSLSPADKLKYRGTTADSVRSQVKKNVKDYYTPPKVDDTSPITAKDALAGISSLDSQYQAVVSAAKSSSARAAAFKRELELIDKEIARVSKDDPGYAGLIEKRNEIATNAFESQLSDAETLRKAQQQKATTDAQAKAIGEKFFYENVQAAAALGDVDALVGLFNEANKAEVAYARSLVVGNVKLLKAAADAEKKNNKAIDDAQAAIDAANKGANFGYEDSRSQEQKDNDEAKAKEKKSNKAQKAYKEGKSAADAFDEAQGESTPADSGGSIETGEDDPNAGETRLQRRQRLTELAIADRNSSSLANAGLDQSRRAVKDAQDRVNDFVSKSEKNTAEYWAAIKTLNDAKVENAHYEIDAVAAIQSAAADSTDPVALANIAADQANKQLAQAKKDADAAKLKGKKRADYLAPFQQTADSANATKESTADQEYQSNLEYSLTMGNISHRKYMDLLKQRSDHFFAEAKAIGKGNEGYDQALKLGQDYATKFKEATDSINDQFNLGDIKVPTVYQIRQSLTKGNTGQVLGNNGSYSTGGNVTNDNSTRNVTLNGVPVETILTMIQDLFGIKARSTAKRRIGA